MHANKQRWVLILDPCIHVSQNYTPYTTGLAQDVFVKDITGKPYLGQVRTRLNGLGCVQYLCAVCAVLRRSAEFCPVSPPRRHVVFLAIHLRSATLLFTGNVQENMHSCMPRS